ncbi:uncharacterized protein LOC116121024 [Pistacia vera]|uniref:uncharacterized protein LOC116121024 n=1 Tax=Pistacia vera TaxID=55513 RepID=UPI001263279D|nr:uncharacterized protein LOC116121024 [Pistacia vera]
MACFAEDPRNLKLGLAADGFNPFSNMSTTYSCWPVMLVTYNLPPWLCMKKENIMLTLLIPGPKQPGKDIDIYLQPLIEDLQELWNNGVNVYDSYTNSCFNLRAILMWTINDFRGYGNLSGCTTKGKVACPLCGDKTNELPLRHNLDVMHVEKNICESIIGTLFDISGKTKDKINARKDLEDMGVCHELHPKDHGCRTYLPAASHTLSKTEKENFSLRGLLPKGPRMAIMRLCAFFNKLCQRVIDREVVVALEDEVVETICFIVECYLVDETVIFYSGYFKHDFGGNDQNARNQDFFSDVILEGHPILGGKSMSLSDEVLERAHSYVLFNTTVTKPFLQMHLEELKQSNKNLERNHNLLQKTHANNFATWLKEKVSFLTSICEDGETLKWLANSPRNHAMSYNGYVINGQRFHTKDVDKSTQNSGVSIEATTICRASAKDTSQVVDVVAYYGVIKEIILLDYFQFQLPIFKCHWANAGHGVKFEDGFTLVNLHQSQNQYVREPFFLASQAKQVFYSREIDSPSWYIVLKAPPRGYYELEMYNEDQDLTSRPEYVTTRYMNIYDDSEEVSYVIEDCEGLLV